MAFIQALVGLGALLALAPQTQAVPPPCIYEEYKCGYTYTLAPYSYVTADFITAVNQTDVIPPLGAVDLLQVLYRCADTSGTLLGNSFCVAGCISLADPLADDECAM